MPHTNLVRLRTIRGLLRLRRLCHARPDPDIHVLRLPQHDRPAPGDGGVLNARFRLFRRVFPEGQETLVGAHSLRRRADQGQVSVCEDLPA